MGWQVTSTVAAATDVSFNAALKATKWTARTVPMAATAHHCLAMLFPQCEGHEDKRGEQHAVGGDYHRRRLAPPDEYAGEGD